MSKFTLEEKLEAIIEYLQGHKSFTDLAKELDTSTAVVRNWVKQYEHHGSKALNPSYTNYSAQFKLDVLKYMNENGTSPNETAAIFNIPDPSTIRKWRRVFEKEGIDGLQLRKKGRPFMKKESIKQTKQVPAEGSVNALEARIKQLEMENAYLKKLNALVQSKEKSPNKTKRK